MAVKLVVDSASDIDLKEAEALGIHMIPMSIQFGDTTYADGIDLSGLLPLFLRSLSRAASFRLQAKSPCINLRNVLPSLRRTAARWL